MKDWVGTQNIIDQAFPIWPMIISFDQPGIGWRIEIRVAIPNILHANYFPAHEIWDFYSKLWGPPVHC